MIKADERIGRAHPFIRFPSVVRAHSCPRASVGTKYTSVGLNLLLRNWGRSTQKNKTTAPRRWFEEQRDNPTIESEDSSSGQHIHRRLMRPR